MDTIYFYKTGHNDINASLTGTAIEQSYSGKKNPYLLQEAEVANADADLTEDVSKIN